MTSDSEDSDSCKILFYMEQDEDGWPPYTAESLWAIKKDNGNFEINNIPFYVRGIALGDTISATWDGEIMVFKEVVESSENCTLRIIFDDLSCKEPVCNALVRLGCMCEGADVDILVAVNIPPETEYDDVIDFLEPYCEKDLLGYEEASYLE